MQYVLTENEYKELCALGSKNENELRRKLQHVCTFAANTIPIETQAGWEKNRIGVFCLQRIHFVIATIVQ